MGLILSEPIKKVVEIPKTLAKFSVEDAKFTQNALTGSTHHPGEKGEKKPQKTSGRFFAEKTVFLRKSCVFACLAWRSGFRFPPKFLAKSGSFIEEDALHPSYYRATGYGLIIRGTMGQQNM
jgi:hypothetical protein